MRSSRQPTQPAPALTAAMLVFTAANAIISFSAFWASRNTVHAEPPSAGTGTSPASTAVARSLWEAYDAHLAEAKYVDLTHAIEPGMPLWDGFSQPKFGAAVARVATPGFIAEGATYGYAAQGFVAGAVSLATDQIGTQLDPPASSLESRHTRWASPLTACAVSRRTGMSSAPQSPIFPRR